MEEIIKHTAKPNPKNATRLFITMFEIQEKVIRKRYKHRYIYFWDFFVVPGNLPGCIHRVCGVYGNYHI